MSRGSRLPREERFPGHDLLWPKPLSSPRYPPPSVLLIEPHADTRELYLLWLTLRGFVVRIATAGDEALAVASMVPPDAIVIEPMVPFGGIALIRALRHGSACPDAALVVLTTLANAEVRDYALEAGADAYLIKPCGVLDMGEAIANASRDRLHLVVPAATGAKPSRPRLRQAVVRSRAIGERLIAGAG